MSSMLNLSCELCFDVKRIISLLLGNVGYVFRYSLPSSLSYTQIKSVEPSVRSEGTVFSEEPVPVYASDDWKSDVIPCGSFAGMG